MYLIRYYLVLTLITLCAYNSTQAQESRHYALFVVKFAESIGFQSENVVIGTYGQDEVFAEIQKIVKLKSKIQIVNLKRLNNLAAIQILFVGSEKLNELSSLKSDFPDDVILVAQDDRYLEKGAHINFIKEDQKIRFRINKEKFSALGLIVSNSLLSLSK
jgi:hypothetical protein